MNGYLIAFWCVIIFEVVAVVTMALACIPGSSGDGRWDRIKTFCRVNNIAIQVCASVVIVIAALICNKPIGWALASASVLLVGWLGAPHRPRVKPQAVSLRTKTNVIARSGWTSWELKVMTGFVLLICIVAIGRLAGFQ